MSETSVLKTTLAKLIKQAEEHKKNPDAYSQTYRQTPVLKHFLYYVQKEMNTAADEANRRLRKKLCLKRNDDELLQFIRAIPVLQPYMEKYICITEKCANGQEKSYWLLANFLRELVSKKNPVLFKRLSASIQCVVRDKKCETHGDLCVRWNESPFDFFGREFAMVAK